MEEPKGKGNATIMLKYDDGVMTQITLHNALYFPDSPVNIISIAFLVDLYDDDNVTLSKYHTIHQKFVGASRSISSILHIVKGESQRWPWRDLLLVGILVLPH